MSKVLKFDSYIGTYLSYYHNPILQPKTNIIIQCVLKITSNKNDTMIICSKTQGGGYNLCTNDRYGNKTFEFQNGDIQSDSKYTEYIGKYIVITVGLANNKQFMKINDKIKYSTPYDISYSYNNGFSIGGEIGSGVGVSGLYLNANIKRLAVFTNDFDYNKIINSKNGLYNKDERGLSFYLNADYGFEDITGNNKLYNNNKVTIIDDNEYNLDYKCLLETKDKYIDIDNDNIIYADKDNIDLSTYIIKNSNVNLYTKYINENEKGKIILNK